MGNSDRIAVVVRPRSPYFAWARRVGSLPVDPATFEHRDSVYLLPDPLGAGEVEDVVSRHWAELFKRELAGWEPDAGYWPPHRDEALFHRWFTVEAIGVVHDLAPALLPH